jgi:hypothetical protein
MTTYLRRRGAGSENQVAIDGESWDLGAQLERLHAWMREHSDFNAEGSEWVVDVGFEPRKSVAVAGYTVSVELMAILSQKNVALWLSDYGKVATEDA